MPGPIGKRSDQLRRRNKPEVPILHAEGGDDVEWPDPPDHWSEYAIEWYESLQISGTSAFFEQSDVAQALWTAELMSRALGSEKLNGQLISAIMSSMSELLTSEGSRRRMRIELARGGVEEDEKPGLNVVQLRQNISKAN